MARPAAKELTERELEVMQVYWQHGEQTAIDARDRLAASGVDRAYVTVANLVRILIDKGFLRTTNDSRPFTYAPVRSRDEVSRNVVGDLLKKLFNGSREKLLAHLLQGRKRLSPSERALLQRILEEDQ